MRKYDILKKITDVGVVAVIRAESKESAISISEAVLKGGIPAIEVTYTVPNASDVIKALAKAFDRDQLVIGAGTVLDVQTARQAILAGATYIVSPSFDKETAILCNTYQIPYMPGCMTITEIVEAMKYGSDIVKLFPGNLFGPSFVKSVKGPLPHANIMPTGGVNLDNISEWFKNGVVAVGIGSDLTRTAKADDYTGIEKKAKDYVEAAKKAKLIKEVK